MKTLYLRIWLTVVAALLLFALVSGWVFQRSIEHEREEGRRLWTERVAAWTGFAQQSLAAADAPAQAQRASLAELSARLALPMALDDTAGARIAASDGFQRREAEAGERPGGPARFVALPLADGRTLWVPRGGLMRSLAADGALPPRPFGPGAGRAPGRAAASRRRGSFPPAPASSPCWRCCSSPSPPAPTRWCGASRAGWRRSSTASRPSAPARCTSA